MGRSSKTIVLSVGEATRTLTEIQSTADRQIFEEKVGPLVGRLRLTASLRQNGAKTAYRVNLKLDQADVVDSGLPKVRYTQVWSHDVTIVANSTEASRKSLYDLTKSLVATSQVEDLVVNLVPLGRGSENLYFQSGSGSIAMPAATVDHSQRICEVWACNLDEEMKKIRQVIRKYNYVAMDTEFPGVVARPIGEFRSNADYQYQLLRCNVDLLKIIQLGLTFMNEQGEYPPGTSTWQFNFKFNLTEDMYAQDSIELLTTSGIQFKKHEEEGIETQYFAELLMTSGVVLCEGVKWLSFHSGYDFGYLIKILTNSNLPEEELDFFEILRLFFPVIYDVKYLMKSCKNLKGGLQEVAEQLELERIGPQHQAGSDSLLTGMAFFKMREMFFEDHIDDAKYCGHLYGLGSGSSYVQNGTGNAYEEEANKQSVGSATNFSLLKQAGDVEENPGPGSSKTIVLSVGEATRTLTEIQSTADRQIFEEKVGPLVGRLRLTASLRQNGAKTAYRVNLKLDQADVVDSGLPKVRYTQVWSHDVTIVANSTEASRKSLYDLTKSLVATSQVEDLVVNLVPLGRGSNVVVHQAGSGSIAMPAATVDHSQRICEVWACNLDEEMKKIRQVIRKYNYVAMDTEFPGVVARPIGEFRSNADYQYQLLRCNVDLLKIIQLGLTFMNEQGEYPPGTSTWQFNFKFNLTEDMYAQDSIELLTTSGIQFKKHEEEGIETQYFAELLMTSGVVLCEGVKWLSFHSGYDFGYLIKILTNSNLPEEELDFFEILRLFFPVIYDVKYLMKSCKNLKGGLQEVAEQLELERIGPQHQAGSDSLLTGMAFFKMREMFFEDHIDDAKYCGHLYGLGSGSSYVQNGTGNAYEEEANKQSVGSA
nr:PCP-tevS-cNOT7-2A-PCP-ppvS-cNOT7 [Vector 2f_pSin-PPVp-AND-TEVp]